MTRAARAAPPILILLLALLPAPARAQPDEGLRAVRHGGVLYVSLDDLARAFGTRLGAGGGAVSLRAAQGVLTMFEGSPDALWQPTGAPAAVDLTARAPVRREPDGLYAPVELLDGTLLEREEGALRLPDGRLLSLLEPLPPPPAGERYEVLELAPGVPALRLFAAGEAGPRTVSALLVDLTLLPLVQPEARAALDALATELQGERALYLVVTALAPSPWEPVFRFSQGGREVEARAPFRLRLLEGDAGRVAPERPVAAVVLLPPHLNLRAPLRVAWGDLEVEVAFR